MAGAPPATTAPVVAFTTPPSYAPRLARLLLSRGWSPLPCPSVLVAPTPRTAAALRPYLRLTDAGEPLLPSFSALAFTSRNGISAVSDILRAEPGPPPLSPAADAERFVVAALGNDAELLTPEFLSGLCSQRGRVRVLVPPVATPGGIVESLGPGGGRRVLCPVPLVVGLEEPPVVPEFLAALAAGGWAPVRVPAYETKWAGPGCAAALLRAGGVDAIVFTSTAEVEGLVKGLEGMGLGWGEVKRRWPGIVVAAHGPVTASGAAAAGVEVEVVGERFGSFEGVVDAVAKRLGAERGFGFWKIRM